MLAENINKALAPFRERRAQIAQKPGYVDEVLAEGARRAHIIAKETIKEVREKMGLP
jgi:tryptophanyl-tRNA synthetase